MGTLIVIGIVMGGVFVMAVIATIVEKRDTAK
jgi:hypothetical protein